MWSSAWNDRSSSRIIVAVLASVAILATLSSRNFCEAGGAYRQFSQGYVAPYVVKETQLVLPVMVNPYWFGYNATVQAGNAANMPTPQNLQQQQQAAQEKQLQPNNSPYVTKNEFREFAKELIAALENREQREYLEEHGGLDRRNVERIFEVSCKSCHSQPAEDGRPQFYIQGRLAPDDNLNWEMFDQMVRLRLMPPKDHAVLAESDIAIISKYASEVWALRRQQAKANGMQRGGPGNFSPLPPNSQSDGSLPPSTSGPDAGPVRGNGREGDREGGNNPPAPPQPAPPVPANPY